MADTHRSQLEDAERAVLQTESSSSNSHSHYRLRQHLVLLVVRRLPGLTAKQIADELADAHLHWGSVEYYLKKLERQGQVTKRRPAKSNRWYPVEPPKHPQVWEGNYG